MPARRLVLFAAWLMLAASAAANRASAAPPPEQYADCPTVLPAEEGERSIVVPSIAPAYTAPHVASRPLPGEHEVEKSLLRQKLAERDQLQQEIDALRETTKTPEQIAVTVRILEINRTKLQLAGIDPNTIATGIVDLANLAALDALVAQNLGKILATPTVLTTSGRPASLSIGGELPIPSLPGEKAGVKTQKYGTQLDVTAVSLGDNKVRVSVQPRISELDASHAIQVAGQQIPALTVRECNFSSVLEFGKSAVLPGLVAQRSVAKSGWAFGSSESVEEVSLVIVVTPELVR